MQTNARDELDTALTQLIEGVVWLLEVAQPWTTTLATVTFVTGAALMMSGKAQSGRLIGTMGAATLGAGALALAPYLLR